MQTPLDSFIKGLQKRQTQEAQVSVFSLPTHTHTSDGFSKDDRQMECETKREGPLTLPRPGALITWEGADLTIRQGIVNFLHTDADGSVWAFVTMLSGGWAAVNSKYMLKIDQ